MGARNNTGIFLTGSSNNPVNAAETVAGVWTPVQTPLDGSIVILFWYCTLTIGATGTSVQSRVRRGTTTAGLSLSAGALVNVTAGNIVTLSGMASDQNTGQGQQQWCLTFQVNAATANSTINDFVLFAFAP